jgi:hypothetical protein
VTSDDYKRGYSKGYNAGTREIAAVRQRCFEQVEDASARAEHAQVAAGIGHCNGCRHWARGSERTLWGLCNASEGAIRGVPWFRGDDGRSAVTTSERFGCVLFAPKGTADA